MKVQKISSHSERGEGRKFQIAGIPVIALKRSRPVVQDPDGNKVIVHKLKPENEKGAC